MKSGVRRQMSDEIRTPLKTIFFYNMLSNKANDYRLCAIKKVKNMSF